MELKANNDIAKCEGIGCAYRGSCGRFLRPAGDQQSWAAYYALEDDDCQAFEPIKVNGHGKD
jgi:hypothetical protein